MVYNTEKIKPITEENILSKTTEYDIYSYYIGSKVEIGTKFNSPLRKDDNPSFGLFIANKTGRLLFKDMGTGHTGNCFKFVQLYLSLKNYKEALERVNHDLNIGLLSRSDKGIKVKTTYKPSRTNISIKRKYISKIDIEYWSQFGIEHSTLRKFKVYPIYKFWINDNISKLVYSNSNPMYAYKIFNKFKIYRPYDNENKWISNTNRYDIQGLEQLPKKGELLIITKSLKDVMCLYELGYNAIAPQNESSIIPENIISNLKKKFDNIILFYDNDKGGVSGMVKNKNKFGFRCIFIPITYKIKDISDFIKYNNMSKANKLLKKLLYEY